MEGRAVGIPPPRERVSDVSLLTCREGSANLARALEGPVMGKARSDSAPVSVDAVIDSLTIQGITFRGPFRTQGKRVIFVVDRCIVLESELADLFEQNKLNRVGIKELGKRIEARPQ
jgi:hypothetical protein